MRERPLDLKEARVQIVPIGVRTLDQLDLPLALPLLERLLALDRINDAIEGLEPDQSLYAVAFCEPVDQAFAMLVDPAQQFAGDADVQRPVLPARQDVDRVRPRRPQPAFSTNESITFFSPAFSNSTVSLLPSTPRTLP
jgi:hypothetical protein